MDPNDSGGLPKPWRTLESVMSMADDTFELDPGERQWAEGQASIRPWPFMAEPPHKKQRVNPMSSSADTGPSIDSAETDIPPQLESMHIQNSPPSSSKPAETAPPANRRRYFPARPSNTVNDRGRRQIPVLAVERATKKEAVPTKPYVPEPPAGAPRYKDGSKFYLSSRREM